MREIIVVVWYKVRISISICISSLCDIYFEAFTVPLYFYKFIQLCNTQVKLCLVQRILCMFHALKYIDLRVNYINIVHSICIT